MARRVKVDMTGVEAYNKASEGQHVVKIVSIDEKTSQGGNDMLQCCFEVTKGNDKGCRVYENYPLVESALWKLKGMLQAIGMKAEGKISLDLDKLIGKQLIIEVTHEDYNGQARARVSECKKLSAADDEDEDFEDEVDDTEEDEEEEKPKKKSSKKAPAEKKSTPKKKAEPEVEEDDEDEDEDWEEDEEEEEEPPKKKKAPAKNSKKKAPAKKASKKKEPEPEEDEDWDDEDEEDWEEA